MNLSPREKRSRFKALAKVPHVETGREFEEHTGQLELDFSPKARKQVQAQRSKRKHAKAE